MYLGVSCMCVSSIEGMKTLYTINKNILTKSNPTEIAEKKIWKIMLLYLAKLTRPNRSGHVSLFVCFGFTSPSYREVVSLSHFLFVLMFVIILVQCTLSMYQYICFHDKQNANHIVSVL